VKHAMTLNSLKKSQKAFTLVEILVTIAIIGLLSSIILAFTRGGEQQAQIAQTLQWSRSVQSLLGADAVGIWNFDEGITGTCPSGKDVCDLSGYGNDGIINGAAYSTNTPSGSGYALSFDGVDDYVEIPNPVTNFPITVSFWMNPNSLIVSHKAVYIHLADGKWVAGGLNLQGFITGGVGIGANVSHFSRNKWQHVILSMTAQNTGKVYVNGKDVTENRSANWGQIGTMSTIGGNGSSFWNGLIDEVRIYNGALTAGEIQQLYAESAPKYRIAGEF